MLRLSFFLRGLPLAAAIACMAVPAATSASAAWAGDTAGKSTGGNGAGSGAGVGKDGRSAEGQATRQTKSLYTFERGLNGELIVRDARGRRVGVGTRDEVTTTRTQDR